MQLISQGLVYELWTVLMDGNKLALIVDPVSYTENDMEIFVLSV